MLDNKNRAADYLFMLVHNALTYVANKTFDFNNVLVNVEININQD